MTGPSRTAPSAHPLASLDLLTPFPARAERETKAGGSQDYLRTNNWHDYALEWQEALAMETWWNMFISWLPFILLILFWVYFMRKMKTSRQGELIERNFLHMERVEALLERIANGLEKERSA
jgi:ATP-dependent Zn protease